MRDPVPRVARALFASLVILSIATSSGAQPPTAAAVPTDEGVWHPLDVTGGEAALLALGVDPSRERAAVMTELIRRLSFSGETRLELAERLVELRAGVADLDALRNAIALASPAGNAPSLAMADDKKTRGKFEDVLKSAGLELKQSKQQYRAELRSNDTASALRMRLSQVGIDALELQKTVNGGGRVVLATPTVRLPLPLSRQLWSKVIFERDVPARLLFTEILSDSSARLLYHGLAGMDAPTRRWMATQHDLVRRIYRDPEAVRSFALFGPSIRISNGKVIVPGESIGERRWSRVLDVSMTKPDQFVRRLFDHNAGRSAGLYFTIAAVDAARQKFLLSATQPGEAGDDRFSRLVSSFHNCYPSHATVYPFALRSHDAALMLLEIGITEEGNLAGPVWRRFWQRVLDGNALPEDPASELRDLKNDGVIDAAWLVDALCGAETTQRGPVFVTVLAANRVFAGTADQDLPDALVALRARRLYPAVFMALEHARVTKPKTYAALARHAARLARLDDLERSVTALRQFQGALSLTLEALGAGTFAGNGDALLESLAEVGFEDERYDGRMADWLAQRWFTEVARGGASTSIEALVAGALAGPIDGAAPQVTWEGQEYTLDLAGAKRRRLEGVRRRQGGPTFDSAMELHRISSALRQSDLTVDRAQALRADLQKLAPQLHSMVRAGEYGDDGPQLNEEISEAIKDLSRIDGPRELKRAGGIGGNLLRSVDFVLAHVLASWAYAPHVGEADSGALIGGDASLHHLLGVAATPADKFQQRWELTMPAGASRAIKGSFLGLQSGLATWSLRRLSNETVPPAPTISGNDLSSFLLTAALSDPRRLDDGGLARIATALAAGAAIVTSAGRDADRLAAAGEMGAMSPWRRELLGWIAVNEPGRLAEQFSMTQRARLGRLSAIDARDWGSVSVVTGCLCLRMPPDRIPEVIVGRAADGLLGGQSADLMLRVASILAELKMPGALASSVLAYAMRDFLDQVKPVHLSDFDAFSRQARLLDRTTVEDYIGAIAAVGALRPTSAQAPVGRPVAQ